MRLKLPALSASLLSSDITAFYDTMRIAAFYGKTEHERADLIHFDIMDGVFVPEITYGAQFVRQIKMRYDTEFIHSDQIQVLFDVHLMVEDPSYIIDRLVDCADIITIHIESKGNISSNLQKIQKSGRVAGLALNPDTPVESIFPYLDILSLSDGEEKKGMVLIMTVVPGKGGQSIRKDAILKFDAIKNECIKRNLSLPIFEADGGIKSENIASIKDKGCDVFVVGSAIFNNSFIEITVNEDGVYKFSPGKNSISNISLFKDFLI